MAVLYCSSTEALEASSSTIVLVAGASCTVLRGSTEASSGVVLFTGGPLAGLCGEASSSVVLFTGGPLALLCGEASSGVVLATGTSGTVLSGESYAGVVLAAGAPHTVLKLGFGEGATETEEQEREAGVLHARAAGGRLCCGVEDPLFYTCQGRAAHLSS